MSRNKKIPFLPWTTKKSDGIEQRYIRKGNSIMLSDALISVNHATYRVYDYMLLESGGKMEFTFPYSKYEKWLSKAGFQNAVNELVKKGFITVEQKNKNLRKANVYKFSDGWKDYLADCTTVKRKGKHDC